MDIIYEQVLKLIVALMLGGIIGWERERSHRPAGLRTHMLICIGATLITIISINYFTNDYARIIAGLITGVGFMGAGTTIAQGRKGVHGLTTAASLWAVTAIGICTGVGWYILSTATTVLVILILLLGKFEPEKEY